MSLFPAYSGENSNQKASSSDKKEDKSEWLSNSSFTVLPVRQKVVIDISSDSSSENEIEELPTLIIINSNSDSENDNKTEDDYHQHKHKKRKKKDKKHRKEKKAKYEKDVKDVYFEDKYRDRLNFTIKSFHGKARPAYEIADRCLGFIPKVKSKKNEFQRYYLSNVDKMKSTKKNDIFKTKKNKKEDENVGDDNFEEEQKLKIQMFNEKLAEKPEDVETWIKYINFQSVVSKYLRFKSQADNKRVTLEKQLSIVNKALETNSDSAELLELKLQFMSELLPADSFSNEVEILLAKDSGNLALWQALIAAVRSSVAMCNTPKVMELYTKCFKVLKHKLRFSPSNCDKHLLGILYESLILLRHTGHWEQMWETIKFNLILNLSIPQEALQFQGCIDEKKLFDLEEVILTSGLPLNQLWLRIESLRERCHWISVDKDQLELIGDSKRYILSEDVADFVHPLMTKDLNFHMGIYFLLSLKVPLLPTRNHVIQSLKMDNLNWSFESFESLLPLIYPQVGEIVDLEYRKNVLSGLLESQLTSGPQFLIFHPAQEPYLDFLRMIFHAIANALPNYRQTSIYVWWLRFERLLVVLGKEDPLKTDTKGKKVKSLVKEFLKKSENRNNLHYYREYAMIELEFGRVESCINILHTAIESLSFQPSRLFDSNEKSALFSAYRTLFETYLRCKNNDVSAKVEHILNIISRMVPQVAEEDRLIGVEKYLKTCVEQFLSNEDSDNQRDAYFMPNLDCDIIYCYAYTLFIRNQEFKDVDEMLVSCLNHTKTNSALQEQLYECKTTILQLYVSKDRQLFRTLKSTLQEALGVHRDNFYMISVFAEIQSESPFWQLNSRNQENQLWQSLALCLANRARIKKLRLLGFFDVADAMINKTLSLYRTLTNMRNVQCCPLIWRLYMLFLREEKLCEKRGEEVYHASVMNCPWTRCIYIDSAEVAPQKLTQIQDVIREKELRMHITPEELDILRG